MIDYGQRYDAKRAFGISEFRSDGSKTNRQTDIEAGEAEKYVGDMFDVPINEDIYGSHGDGGVDLVLNGVTVDVVHLGIVEGRARRTGNLLINPHEPHRHAEIYVVVRGSLSEGFETIGWLSHTELVKRPRKDFGYGLRYNCPIEDLHSMTLLLDAWKTQQ